MKNLVLLLSLIFFVSISSSCQSDAPSKVLKGFKSKFAKAENVKWEQESETEWEAEFLFEGVNLTAAFDTEGNWLETDKDVSLEEIPAEVFKTIHLTFEEFDIEEWESIETPDFVGYKFEIEVGEDGKEVMFEVIISSTGELIKKEISDDDGEGGDDEGIDADEDDDDLFEDVEDEGDGND